MTTLACAGPAGATRDASVSLDVGVDARDARIDDAAADAPPPVPVLPVQFWSAPFTTELGWHGNRIPIAIAIDARAESGGVRAIVGANGETLNLWLDVVEPGRLVARMPLDLPTTTYDSECTAPLARLMECTLNFTDGDHDGVFETLRDLRGIMTLREQDGRPAATSVDVVARAMPDDVAPSLELWPRHPIRGDVIRLVSSEPLDPRFTPYLEGGGRRVALTPTSRAAPPSSWTIALDELPTASYVLGAEGSLRDLAGNAGTLPEAHIDLTPQPPLADPSFETSLVGVTAEHGARAIEGTEVPLEGARSVFTEGRTLLSLTLPDDAVGIRMLVRLHVTGAATTMAPWFRVLDEHGVPIGGLRTSAIIGDTGTVDGFGRQSGVVTIDLRLEARARTALVDIDPRGVRDPRCLGLEGPAEGDRLGMTIDAIEAL